MEKIKKPVYQPEDERKIDYKLDEFRKKNKISKTYFKNNIKKYKNYFDINVEEIKNFDEDTNYNIPFLVEPIMGIMFKNFKLNPLVDGRINKNAISIDKFIEYNKKIFEDIEELPNDIKFNIKNTSTYEFNYILNEVIPIILNKMTILFSLIISESSVSAGNSYIDLIDALDSWIVNFVKHSVELKEKKENIDNNEILMINIDNYGQFNFEKNNTYLMDKILKDEYINNINKVNLLKEKMKIIGTENLFEYINCKSNDKKIDKSKIDRERVIEWINNEELNKIYDYSNLLSEKEQFLQDFKSKLTMEKIDIDILECQKRKMILDIKEIINIELYTLKNKYSNYTDVRNVVDKILHSTDYDIYTIMLYKKVKLIINSKEYISIFEQDTDCLDEDYDNFNIFLEKLAEELWIETYKDDYDKVKKVKNIIDNKYKELDNKKSQLNLIRSYLSKAMGQTITPILQKEIMELSK